MGSAPSKPVVSTPAVDEKRSSQSGVEQTTERLQALSLRGLGRGKAASTDGALSEANVREWEEKAGKVGGLYELYELQVAIIDCPGA